MLENTSLFFLILFEVKHQRCQGSIYRLDDLGLLWAILRYQRNDTYRMKREKKTSRTHVLV